jgi:hypothetical protein
MKLGDKLIVAGVVLIPLALSGWCAFAALNALERASLNWRWAAAASSPLAFWIGNRNSYTTAPAPCDRGTGATTVVQSGPTSGNPRHLRARGSAKKLEFSDSGDFR